MATRHSLGGEPRTGRVSDILSEVRGDDDGREL